MLLPTIAGWGVFELFDPLRVAGRQVGIHALVTELGATLFAFAFFNSLFVVIVFHYEERLQDGREGVN